MLGRIARFAVIGLPCGHTIPENGPAPALEEPMRALMVVAGIVLTSLSAWAQAPPPPQNLQYFPKDIPRPQLIQRMREFSFALDVRCQYCHAGGDGVSFDGVNFASDDKPAKVKARALLRMVD